MNLAGYSQLHRLSWNTRQSRTTLLSQLRVGWASLNGRSSGYMEFPTRTGLTRHEGTSSTIGTELYAEHSELLNFQKLKSAPRCRTHPENKTVVMLQCARCLLRGQ